MEAKDLIFRSLKVIDPQSNFHKKVVDVVVKNGIITELGENLKIGDLEEIDGKGLSFSPGIFDMQVSSGEPGLEERETVDTLTKAALQGGITDVLLMPTLFPLIENRGQVEYLLSLYQKSPLNVHITGTLTNGMAGKELSGLIDMRSGGAIAFSDDKSALNNPVLLHLALQYSQSSGGLIMVHCEDEAMSLGGKVNEGTMSVRLGMKGAPSLSEAIGIMRNLAIAEYHNVRIHFNGISTERGVALIREAKSKGIQVSCSVYAHHLYFNEDSLEGFDSNFKVWPPLRTQNDQEALFAGLLDGTIDVICSDHRPKNQELKEVEFEFASFGMIGLETLFGATLKACYGKLSTEDCIEKLCSAPRKLLGLKDAKIERESKASFFLYNDDEEFTFTDSMIRSKSSNTPFLGNTLKGKIAGTYTASGWYSAV